MFGIDMHGTGMMRMPEPCQQTDLTILATASLCNEGASSDAIISVYHGGCNLASLSCVCQWNPRLPAKTRQEVWSNGKLLEMSSTKS